MPPEPEAAALTLGLTGPSEANELGELAWLLGHGSRASARPANALAAAAAATAAKAAAAVATEAAARASETAGVAAHAKARRQALGVEEATPRAQAAAESLAMDLQPVLDEASWGKQKMAHELAADSEMAVPLASPEHAYA